jgi:hypothetical protein
MRKEDNEITDKDSKDEVQPHSLIITLGRAPVISTHTSILLFLGFCTSSSPSTSIFAVNYTQNHKCLSIIHLEQNILHHKMGIWT